MLEVYFENDGIVFPQYRISENGTDLIGKKPQCDEYYAFCILRELVAMQKAGMAGEIAIIQYEDLFSYAQSEGNDEEDIFQKFGFPPVLDKKMYLNCNGPISDPNFVIILEFPNSTVGNSAFNIRVYEIHGCIVHFTDDNSIFRLTFDQYQLYKEIIQFNKSSIMSTEEKLLSIAKIKKLCSKIHNITLHPILESENIVIPEKISLSVSGDEGQLVITPKIVAKGINDDEFKKKFAKNLKVTNSYNFDTENGRKRIIFSPLQKKALEQIKKNHIIKDPEKVLEFINNPPKEFDEAEIDVSELYSERVKGIGIYRPKAYPFVSPYKSEWLVGIELEDNDGERFVVIESPESLQELSTAISDAQRNAKEYVQFKGEKISIEAAITAEREARLKFEKKNKYKPETNNKVLLIKENVEALEFTVEKEHKKCVLPAIDINCINCAIELKQHQIEGISTLLALKSGGYTGAILADDMGLGKTVQVLAFLELLSKHQPVLACIVCPAGLIENWLLEHFNCFPNSKLDFIDLRHTPAVLEKYENSANTQYENEILLFSYEFLRSKQLQICSIPWNIAILDEAQRIKTPGTLVTNAAKALKAQFKIALTGTPVENSFYDLWCIYDFCIPGFLGSAKSFGEEFDLSNNDDDVALISKGKQIRNKLGQTLIRRTKSEVLKDLPPKYESDRPEHFSLFEPDKTVRIMPDRQVHVYDSTIIEHKKKHINDKLGMIGVLNTLKMISDHPLLINKTLELDSLNKNDSAKCLLLIDILNKVKRRNEKAIIFSEFRKTQRFLAKTIDENFGILPHIINGDTPTETSPYSLTMSRSRIIQQFNESEGFNVIIMSPIAAGVGLTVTGANHVIHFSRHWNPAKEDQATDRAYRIGQKKEVYVYYLQAKHPNPTIKSFDENLAALLSSKRKLSGAVLYPIARMEVKPEEMFNRILNEVK
jgi:superfamily II DNA or RNA helicase